MKYINLFPKIKVFLNIYLYFSYMVEENNEIVTKRYICKICNSTHSIKINKDLLKGKTKFPFPFVILHDSIIKNELKEVLTILYVDNNLEIRHTEIQEIVDDNLFSKSQVVEMTKTLFEENERLREDVAILTKELNKLKRLKAFYKRILLRLKPVN